MMGLRIIDHIVIAQSGSVSMRQLGLIEGWCHLRYHKPVLVCRERISPADG
jgi:hypothetical protein